MSGKVKVMINGLKEEVPEGASLTDLFDYLGEFDKNLIVELNGGFVYPRDYRVTTVVEGDTLEFINPDFGG